MLFLSPAADPVIKEQSLSNSDNNMVSSGNTTARWNTGNGLKKWLTLLIRFYCVFLHPFIQIFSFLICHSVYVLATASFMGDSTFIIITAFTVLLHWENQTLLRLEVWLKSLLNDLCNVSSLLSSSSSTPSLSLLCSLPLCRSGRRRMFVTSTLYPVVTVTLTSVQWQWIKVTLTSYTLTDMCIQIHTSTHKHIDASTPSIQTHADTYTYTLLLCISLRLACPGSLSSSLTNELEAAPPSSPKSSFPSQLSLM